MEREHQHVFTELETPRTSDSCRHAFPHLTSLAKIQVLSEATALEQSIAAVVVAGGGDYRGIQRGSQRMGTPDLVLFNDSATGTTLALIANGKPFTARKVQAKIARSRAKFASYGHHLS